MLTVKPQFAGFQLESRRTFKQADGIDAVDDDIILIGRRAYDLARIANFTLSPPEIALQGVGYVSPRCSVQKTVNGIVFGWVKLFRATDVVHQRVDNGIVKNIVGDARKCAPDLASQDAE